MDKDDISLVLLDEHNEKLGCTHIPLKLFESLKYEASKRNLPVEKFISQILTGGMLQYIVKYGGSE